MILTMIEVCSNSMDKIIVKSANFTGPLKVMLISSQHYY